MVSFKQERDEKIHALFTRNEWAVSARSHTAADQWQTYVEMLDRGH